MEPSLAGPRRPQDRIPLRSASASFREALAEITGRDGGQEPVGDAHDEAVEESYPASDPPANGAPGHRAEAPVEPLTPRTARRRAARRGGDARAQPQRPAGDRSRGRASSSTTATW